MWTRSLGIILLLTLSAIVLGFYIAPSHREVALMHMSDADFDEALKLYANLEDQGDDSIRVVMPLAKLYLHFGNTNKAVGLLQLFIDKHPQSVEARKQLADLYKVSQRLYDYCNVLEDLQKISSSTEWLRKLADTYDLMGQYAKERFALQRLIASKDYKPREEDYVKLTVLSRVANADDSNMIEEITDGIQKLDFKVNLDTLHLANQLLLEKNENGRALSLAKTFLAKTGNEDDAVALSSQFQSQRDLDAAYGVIEPYLADLDKSLDLEAQYVSVMLAQRKDDEVFKLLSRQFAENSLPASLNSTLIDEAIKRKDIELVASLMRTTDLAAVPENNLLQYADFSFRSRNIELAQLMENRLGQEYLQRTPLLAAALAAIGDKSQKAIESLVAYPEDKIGVDEKLVVAGILIEFGRTDRAAALFDHVPMADILSTLDPWEVANLYLNTNQAAHGEQKLEEAEATIKPPEKTSLDMALFFLAAGEGKDDVVGIWLKEHPDTNPRILSDALALVNRFHHQRLALDLAHRVYEAQPSDENMLQYGEALLAEYHYADAFKLLQKTAEKNPAARQLSLDALAGWINHPDWESGNFTQTIAGYLDHLKLSIDEKRNFAYTLQDAGFRDLAEGYFIDVAGNQSFESRDVQELIGFWGDHLTSAEVNWMLGRARNAPIPERVKWLSYLNDAGKSSEVVTFLQKYDRLAPELIDVEITALADSHNDKDLQTLLEKVIADEDDSHRLENYAKIAVSENLPATAGKAWQALYDIDPNNAEAAHELGLRAYDEHRYADAANMLQVYLKNTDEDYRANYVYAEILKTQNKNQEAAAYYKKALAQVIALDSEDIDTRADKAQLLFLNGQTDKAINELRNMLADNPDNKMLRANLAEIFIQTKNYKEASALLGR